MDIMRLTPKEIAELNMHSAMRIIEHNVNNLITLNKQLTEAIAEKQ